MVKVEEITLYLSTVLPDLGINKQRELGRLMYEIAKRDGLALSDILPAEKNLTFERAKKLLLQKRYPFSSDFYPMFIREIHIRKSFFYAVFHEFCNRV